MTTPINGLVLAGGKSTRMGQDKSSIKWHEKEQQYYLADLLESFCADVFISRREKQIETNHHYKILVDSYRGIGPYGAILSAFTLQPDKAWLVIACDLPLIDKNILSKLLENRDETKIATTYKSPFDGLPEPLITIWEPKSHEVLLSYLSNGYTCPRKVLINSNDVKILESPDSDSLMNVNTPDDFAKAQRLMLNKQQSDHAR